MGKFGWLAWASLGDEDVSFFLHQNFVGVFLMIRS